MQKLNRRIAATLGCLTVMVWIYGVLFPLANLPTYFWSKLWIGTGIQIFCTLNFLTCVAWILVSVGEFIGAGEPRCRRCGYILKGLSEPRCPECGERI